MSSNGWFTASFAFFPILMAHIDFQAIQSRWLTVRLPANLVDGSLLTRYSLEYK